MSNMNTETKNGVGNNINLVTANNFTTTKESRNKLLSLLSAEEQKMFKIFVKSLGAK